LVSISSAIISDRLANRGRVLRIRWHAEGESLLKSGKYLEFADGLLRLMRQLDAISAAVARLPQPAQIGFGVSQTVGANLVKERSGVSRPTRGPTNSA